MDVYSVLILMWTHNLIVSPHKHILIFREAGPRRRPSSSVRWRTTRSCTWRWSASGTTFSRWTSVSRCWTPPRTRFPSQSVMPSCSWSSRSSSRRTPATSPVIGYRQCPYFHLSVINHGSFSKIKMLEIFDMKESTSKTKCSKFLIL